MGSGSGMEAVAAVGSLSLRNGGGVNGQLLHGRERSEQGQVQGQCWQFQMPLHYPRYTRADYETMPEWKLDCLLQEYGLPVTGDVESKRKFAMGSFLWPN